ncbi:hypothetical protein JQ614_35740 [Bradyrhizobium diazoefficiens]|uniref:hypothetical protein n=1 Tax=Bradyrhizobium diazoefficiens TaxID=1355477 RepID=UPI001B8BF47C|nr:hypothetical protein [Bradyrhizobium diazoefficiens]MBR0866803.1 hypothetical protein [Bradyrhizobium diazoefficiens]MBR0891242.1 hypothetical protein [Bradyrhizobium diazoefficiens]MBR0923241.1 hypothetical protein [Bradyrhizobium diazoefficiens]
MSDQVSSGGTTVAPTSMTGNEVLQQALFAGEMQVVVAALFDGVSDAALIPGAVASAVKSDCAVQYVVARAGVDVPALLGKLDTLPPEALSAIRQGVTQFRTMSESEMFGVDGLPSRATLARLALVKTRGPAAWGLAVVQLSDWWTHEFVLRQDPAAMGLGHLPYSLDDTCAALVELVKSERAGETVPKGKQIAFGLSSLIALRTGWRYFRVEERNACAVVEIPGEALLSDLYRGELGGLVLQGINAPERELA